jgi:hypothetical protein
LDVPKTEASEIVDHVVATLTFSGAVAVVALRKLVPEKMILLGIVTLVLGALITLAGV